MINYHVEYRIAGSLADWTIVNATNNLKQLHGLFAGTDYEWRVKSVCNGQKIIMSGWSVKQKFTTNFSFAKAGGTTMSEAKSAFGEVYPNPVLHTATVSFALNKASPVRITLTDVHGKSLKVIADKNFSEGIHQVRFSRELLPVGIYFLQIKTNYGVMTKKVLIE